MKKVRLELVLIFAGLTALAGLEFLHITARYSSIPNRKAIELKVANGRVGVGVMPNRGFGFNEINCSLRRDKTLVEKDRFAEDSEFLVTFPIWLVVVPVFLPLLTLAFCRLRWASLMQG